MSEVKTAKDCPLAYIQELQDKIVALNTELFYLTRKCQRLNRTLETEQNTTLMLIDALKEDKEIKEKGAKKRTEGQIKKLLAQAEAAHA